MSDQDGVPPEIAAIVESAVLSGAVDKACEEADARIQADPEWTTPKYVHVHTLVEAFAVGAISADPWHRRYRLPPQFEEVVNAVAAGIQRHFGDEVVPCISLVELEPLFWHWASLHPAFEKWNEPQEGFDQLVAASSRYSPTPDRRDFISLHALIRNTTVYIRDHHRRNEDFERRTAGGRLS